MTKGEAFENSTLFMGLTTKNGYKVHKLYSQKASDGAGDFHWDRASTAYRMNQEGVLEEMANNFPRVDYTNTCPELLIEEQSTNLVHRSQEFDNASWTKINSTVTSNAEIAPDSTTTGDKLVATAVNNVHLVVSSISNISNWTFSIYAKKGEYDRIIMYAAGTYYVGFNLTSGIVESTLGIGITNAKIKNVGNGWFRCSFTSTSTSTGTAIAVGVYNAAYTNGNTDPIFTGDGTSGIYIWGAQLEEKPYATSYIPTTSASVTRVRDEAINTTTDFTGLTGTIFVRARVEDSVFTKDDTILSLWGEDADHYILIYSDKDRNLKVSTYENPDQNDYSYALASDGIYNIAVGYDFSGVNNKLNIAINGVLKRANATQTNNAPTILNTFELGNLIGTLPQIDNRVIGVMWFDSQLSDSDLVNITT